LGERRRGRGGKHCVSERAGAGTSGPHGPVARWRGSFSRGGVCTRGPGPGPGWVSGWEVGCMPEFARGSLYRRSGLPGACLRRDCVALCAVDACCLGGRLAFSSVVPDGYVSLALPGAVVALAQAHHCTCVIPALRNPFIATARARYRPHATTATQACGKQGGSCRCGDSDPAVWRLHVGWWWWLLRAGTMISVVVCVCVSAWCCGLQ